MKDMKMFCHQCEMSAEDGCGAKGQPMGTCGKSDTLALLQDTMVFGLKGLSAYRHHAHELGADTSNVDRFILRLQTQISTSMSTSSSFLK